MEGPDPPTQTQNGDMEATESPRECELPTVPSLSALLADESIDHIGYPIPVEYSKLWVTKASANRKLLGRLSEDDLRAIHEVIAPAAMDWENENGTAYHHKQSTIPNEHVGLEGAKLVLVRLNLGEGERIDSWAGDKALRNNDFTPRMPTAMPSFVYPGGFKRWRRACDTRHDRKISYYPAHYMLWQSPLSQALYAQIPKPLEDMSRAASCDHCRIHDPERAGEMVDYFDDRPHVDGIRETSAVDTAAVPFSLCRYHWWYLWSGELLRPSQVHALEMLISEEGLRERWGISHMREFLDSMRRCSLTPEESDGDDDDQSRGPKFMLLLENGQEVQPHEENSSLTDTRQATAASTDAQQTVPGGQHAGTATVDGPSSQQTNGDSHTMDDNYSPPSITSSAPAPEFHNSGPVEPAEPPHMNGQSTAPGNDASVAEAGSSMHAAFGSNGVVASNPVTADTHQQTDDGPESQANGLAISNPVAPVPILQTNGAPARPGAFLYSPPKAPRASLRGRRR